MAPLVSTPSACGSGVPNACGTDNVSGTVETGYALPLASAFVVAGGVGYKICRRLPYFVYIRSTIKELITHLRTFLASMDGKLKAAVTALSNKYSQDGPESEAEKLEFCMSLSVDTPDALKLILEGYVTSFLQAEAKSAGAHNLLQDRDCLAEV